MLVAQAAAHREHPLVVGDENVAPASDVRLDVPAILATGLASRPVPIRLDCGPRRRETRNRLFGEEVRPRVRNVRRHGELSKFNDTGTREEREHTLGPRRRHVATEVCSGALWRDPDLQDAAGSEFEQTHGVLMTGLSGVEGGAQNAHVEGGLLHREDGTESVLPDGRSAGGL